MKKSLSNVLYQNVAINYVFKVLSVVLGLLLTKYNLRYLGVSLFGIWATIASVASWINYGDWGIGNGVRNGLAEAFAHNDTEKQRKLIVTSFRSLFIIACVLFCIIAIVTEIIVSIGIIEGFARLPMHITNGFFCADLFLGIGKAFAYGYQKSWVASFGGALTTGLKLLTVLLLIACGLKENLILFAILSGICGMCVNVSVLLVFVKKIGVPHHPSYYDKSLGKQISGMGIKFFVIQIACLVLYASDNLIIKTILTNQDVTKYELINKVYNAGDSFFAIFMVALWSAVAYAFAKNDTKWIKKEIKRMLLIWLFYSLGVIAISAGFNLFVKLWLGSDAIYYEGKLVILFAVYAILTAFGAIFVNVTNGIGRLNISLACAIIAMLLNIPLSIIFASNLNMGILGVKLATLICCFGSIIIVPIDIIRFLKNVKEEV